MLLRSQRLELRPWTLEDAPLFSELTRDDGFRRFSNFGPMSPEEARLFLESRLPLCQDGYCLWGAFEGDQAVGHFQLFGQTLDERPGVWPEIGYRLRSSAWGRGLATEAARCMLDYGYGELGLETLYAFIDPKNEPSQAVARRLGFSAGEPAKFKGFDIVLWSRVLPFATPGSIE